MGVGRWAAVVVAMVGAIVPLEAQWPQFRGPDGNGITAAAVPLTWSETEHIAWATPVHGRAWSSPIVLGPHVWVTTASEDGRRLGVVVLDKRTGAVVRDQQLFTVAQPQYAHPFNSYGSPTPVAEPGRVYVTFGSPGTAALDAESGQVLWERRDLECNHFRGAGSSPVIFENLLLMHYDGSDQQYLVALDKQTGKTVWKTERSVDFQDVGPDGRIQADGDLRKGFATPQVITVGGAPVMISLGAKAAYAYDPRTGRELWRIVDRSAHSPSTRPVFGHGLVYYPTGWGAASLMAVRPDGRGDVTASHVAWRATRAVPNKPSLLLSGDLIFMVNDAGIVSCLDAVTGDYVWQSRVSGEYSASPLLSNGRIYLFNEEGKTTVIEAGRTFKVLAENQLGDGFMASPAVDGDALILRSRTKVYRVE